MRVPVQFISFSCFLFFVTVVQGQEIACTAPDISNGYVVEPMPEYYKDAILKYRCLQGFKPREEIPRCAKFGWTLNPECDEVTCELKSTTFGVKKIIPEGKTIFRAGERMEITCTEKHWFYTKESIKSFTCKDDGQWDHEPVCEEIMCEVPRDQHLSSSFSFFWGDRKLGAIRPYSCKSGYYKKAAEATCTRGGWTPNPLCAEKMCAVPNITNAEIVGDQRPNYRISSRIQYKCNTGFEPEQPVQITCNLLYFQTEWTGIQQCTEATCPLNTTVEDITIERIPDIEGPVKPGHTLIFSCSGQGLKLKGQSEIICQSNGEWSSPFPKCEEVMCVANLPANMRSDVTEDGHLEPEVSIRPGHTITLSCVGMGLKLQGQSKITCLASGEWNVPFPKCIREKCGRPPNVNFADTTELTKPEYNSRERVEYICFNKYTLDQRHPYSKYLTCEQGEWIGNIKCLKPCTVMVEEMDERGIQLKWGGRQKIFSPHEDKIIFACQWGKRLIVNELIQTCNDGEMILPQCV